MSEQIKEEEQVANQNLITNKFIMNVRDYFVMNPKLHFTINYSRIFNTYFSIAEIINIALTILLFFNYTHSLNAMILFSI